MRKTLALSALLLVAGNYSVYAGKVTPGVGTPTTSVDPGSITSTEIAVGAVTSSGILNGAIINEDVNAAADIAQSKVLNLTTDLGARVEVAGDTMTGTLTMDTGIGIQFPSVGGTPSSSEALLFYDPTNDTMAFFKSCNSGNLKFLMDRDMVFTARNNSGGALSKGDVVYPTGSTGVNITVSPAQANTLTTSLAVGVAFEDIPNSQNGCILGNGRLEDLDTSAFSEGDILWLSSAIAGGFQDTIPPSPNHAVAVAIVIVDNPVNGVLGISIADLPATGFGTANQLLGMNNAGTDDEHKTLAGTANQLIITNAAELMTFSLDTASVTLLGPDPGHVLRTGDTMTGDLNVNAEVSITAFGTDSAGLKISTAASSEFVVAVSTRGKLGIGTSTPDQDSAINIVYSSEESDDFFSMTIEDKQDPTGIKQRLFAGAGFGGFHNWFAQTNGIVNQALTSVTKDDPTAGYASSLIFGFAGDTTLTGFEVTVATGTTPFGVLGVSPSFLGTVIQGDADRARLRIAPLDTTGSNPRVEFADDCLAGTGCFPAPGVVQGVMGYDTTNDLLGIRPGTDITASTGITIDNSGKVGVGVTNPTGNLQVAGNVVAGEVDIETTTYRDDGGTVVGSIVGRLDGLLLTSGKKEMWFLTEAPDDGSLVTLGEVLQAPKGRSKFPQRHSICDTDIEGVGAFSGACFQFRISTDTVSNLGFGPSGSGIVSSEDMASIATVNLDGLSSASFWLGAGIDNNNAATPQIILDEKATYISSDRDFILYPNTVGTSTITAATGDAAFGADLSVSGNVGIGTTGPEANLHVLGTSGDVLIISSGVAVSQRLWIVEASGDLLPGTSAQQNIGSPSNPVGEIFVGENSISFVNSSGVVSSSLSVSGSGALQFRGITVTDSSGDLDISASELPADGYAPTYVNVAGDAMTGQLTLSGSTLTVTGNAFSVNGSDLIVTGGEVGVGISNPSSELHIKANTPGTVGSDPAGQLIIQSPDTNINTNAVITGYNSDGSGNPDQQLWYLGSSSSGNENITLLNRRNASLALGTNGSTRLTVLGSGNVGIGTAIPDHELDVVGAVEVSSITAAGAGGILITDDGGNPSMFLADGGVTAGFGTASPFGGGITIENTSPHLYLFDNDATADNGLWDIFAPNENLFFGAVNDANTLAVNFMEIRRTGITIDSVVFPNGNVGIGTTNPVAPLHVVGDSTITANAFIGGFMELGSGSPKIKMKKLTGTTGATEGDVVDVVHGLTLSKIIGLQALVTADNGNLIPPELSTVVEFQYSIFIDATNVRLDLSATNSANLLSNAFTVLLTYEE